MSNEKSQNLVEVILAKVHTHADVEHAIGTPIKVTEPERDWLIAQKIVAPQAAKESTK
ncbi:DUF7210 family protein [Lysobacter sp. CA199]|uniref:DUF7210 family protein n=1 Tax=Lysobacter sp. CA199 TaxID=3455608 RepID=UPI003F8D5A58